VTGSTPTRKKARWIRAKNTHSEDVPAHGVVKVSGATSLGSAITLEVTRPAAATDAMTGQVAFAAPLGIKAGTHGHVTMQWPCIARYDDAGTPASGELWGPQADSFELLRGNDGFLVLGDPIASPSRIHVIGGFHRPLFIRFELDAALATADDDVAITVLESFSGITSGITAPATVKNLAIASNYAHSGAEDDVGLAFYNWNDGTYTILRMEC
jgi:hypothetical protein